MPSVGGGEKDAAVIVGVEKYLSVPAIQGAVLNANDWYSHLTGTLKVPASRVTLLRNSDATVEKMRKHLAEAAKKVGPGGTLWFVYVGHGAPAADGKDGVLVGFDAQQDPDSLYARSLPQREVIDAAAKIKDGRAVLVIDACFSGKAGNGAELVKGLQPLIAVKIAEQQPSAAVTVLTAGKADQFAGPLPGANRPAFSYLMLGAFRGWAERDGDGYVTAGEAIDYANEALATVVKDRSQSPELARGSADDVLARVGKDKAPDLAAMVVSQTGGTTTASGSSGGTSLTNGGGPMTVSALAFNVSSRDPADKWLGESFPDALINELVRARQVRIVEREFLDKILDEQKLQASAAFDPSTAVQAGRLMGAKVIITGKVTVLGEAINVQTRLLNVENGEVFQAESTQGQTRAMFALQKEIARKISAALSLEAAIADSIGLEKTELALGTYAELNRLGRMAKGLPLFGLDPARARKSGEYQQALGLADALVTQYPRLAQAHYYRALFSLHSEDYDTADQESDVAMKLAADDIDAALLRANVLQARNDLGGAIGALGAITQKFPTDARAWYVFGRLELMQQRKERAALYLLAALERTPTLPEAETTLRTLLGGPDGTAVIAGIGAADPRLVPAAQAYRAFFKNEKAGLDRIAWEAMRNTPNLHIGYYLQAVHSRSTRRNDEARSYFARALALRPTFPETHRELGLTMLDLRYCAEGRQHVGLYLKNANFVDDYAGLAARMNACR